MTEHDHNHDHAHDHDHHHGHAHDDPFHVHPTKELNLDDMDPANRSLAEALRISFGLLKWVVVLLVAVFLAYGSYNEIKEGQVGIKLRFGAIVGEKLDTGVHLAWPEPIEKVITVPIKAQTVEVRAAFMFSEKEAEATLTDLSQKTVKTGYPDVRHDGYLLTADRNIVHGIWKVSFKIDPAQVESYVIHIGTLERAHNIVRQAAERAVLHVVAQTTVDDFVQAQIDNDEIRRLAQAALDEMQAGIDVTEVSNEGLLTPPNVRDAFALVNEEESNKKKAIDKALKEQSDKLLDTAGEGYPRLLELIRDYQAARALNDDAAAAGAKRRLDEVLTDKDSMDARGIGGEVYRLVRAAQADQTNLVKQAAADVRDFEAHYAQFRNDPELRRITMKRLWYNTLVEVFGKDHELFRIPPNNDHLYIEIGSNPEISKRKAADKQTEVVEGAE